MALVTDITQDNYVLTVGFNALQASANWITRDGHSWIAVISKKLSWKLETMKSAISALQSLPLYNPIIVLSQLLCAGSGRF